MQKRLLVIRLSSIGDILLTTALLRCLKKQGGHTIHFLTKPQFFPILSANPNIDELIAYDPNEFSSMMSKLRNEDYDLVLDLHKNLRTYRIKQALKSPSISLDKINFKKWLTVRTKNTKYLPALHIVDRYFETVLPLAVQYDGLGLDFYFVRSEEELLNEIFEISKPLRQWIERSSQFVCVVLAAAHKTKSMPLELLSSIINQVKKPVVLIGGNDYEDLAEELLEAHPQCVSAVGKTTIEGSAELIKRSAVVITPDTGMMHIAAALKKPIVSVWGNTVPEFGMYPFMPDDFSEKFEIRAEVNGLNCRPCSKIGFDQCPKGHFKCMADQNAESIADSANQIIELS